MEVDVNGFCNRRASWVWLPNGGIFDAKTVWMMN